MKRDQMDIEDVEEVLNNFNNEFYDTLNEIQERCFLIKKLIETGNLYSVAFESGKLIEFVNDQLDYYEKPEDEEEE